MPVQEKQASNLGISMQHAACSIMSMHQGVAKGALGSLNRRRDVVD
jgi:hypothetical protein